MEMLPINNDAGQSYGYILYSTVLPHDAKNVLIIDAADLVSVILDDILIAKVDSPERNYKIVLPFLQVFVISLYLGCCCI